MLSTQLVQDISSQKFKILRSKDAVSNRVKPLSINSESQAREFIQKLRQVPRGYWRGLVTAQATSANAKKLSDREIDQLTLKLLSSGQLKVYEVHQPESSNVPVENLTVKNGNASYRFANSSSLLINRPREHKEFHDQKEAETYLSTLKLNKDQAEKIHSGLSLNSAGANADPLQSIIESMAAGETIVVVDNVSSAPASDAVIAEQIYTETKASLGPEAAAVVEVAKEEPPCSLERVSIECSHGRNIGITNKTELTPSLDVIATETKEKGFDLIKAEIQASALCSQHKNSGFSVNKEHKLKSKSDTKIEFKVNCGEWDFSNVFDRIWLPSVSPKVYNVSVKDTCKAPDIKVKDFNINVYPDIKWHWKTSIDFGKLEFVPGQSKVEYSDFDIKGNVVLTYEGEEHDASEKYKEYIQEPLDGFKKVCDAISTVLEVINDPKAALMRIGTQTMSPPPPENEDNKDGNATRLIVDWPKLNITYDSTLIENESSSYVDHDYSIKLTAKPLLDIDIQVDVLESMMALAPGPAGAVIRYAKERVEGEIGEDQDVGLRGELDIIFTVKATVNINESEINGRHNIIEHDKTVKPVKGDIKIPATLEGAIKAEGKWFILSFSVNYSMVGKSEWAGDFEFGSDETGIYFSNTVEFKGIDVTLTKYEEAKASVESSADLTDDMFDADGEVNIEDDNTSASIELESGTVKGEATVKAKDDKRWSWLKPNEDAEKEQPKKHYIVKR